MFRSYLTTALAVIVAWLGLIGLASWESRSPSTFSLKCFVMAGAAAATVAFLTVGIMTARAAMMNPVHTLRDE